MTKNLIIFLISISIIYISPLKHVHAENMGANSLFIGHSFFVPVAKAFEKMALENGFSEHKSQFVFASGPKGLPGALWDNENKKSKINSILAAGDIELFGMTSANGRRGDALEIYQRWIDLALSHNPDTKFFIGHSWIPGGPKADAEKFDQKIEKTGQDAYATIEKLRARYPNLTIYFVNYGKAASIMRTMFDAGELDDIAKLAASEGRRRLNGGSSGERSRGILSRITDRRNNTQSGETQQSASSAADHNKFQDALFIDAMMGHAGPMMTQMMSLVWLHFLYGADIEKLNYNGWNDEDVEYITTETIKHNEAL